MTDDLINRAEKEIKRLEAKANQMVADKINLRSELLSVQAKLAVAVEALEDQLRSDEAEVRVFHTSGQANPPVERRIDRTRAALAKIKGEKP